MKDIDQMQLAEHAEQIERKIPATVTTQDERDSAVAYIRWVKDWRKSVEKFFAPSREATRKAWKAVIANEKQFTDRADAAEKAAKAAILTYDREQERKRREEEERLRKEAEEKARAERERLQAEALKITAEDGKYEVLRQADAVKAAEVSVATTVEKSGHDSTSRTWKARVVDIEQVPRLFLVVDQRALDEFARESQGREAVPGVEFYQKETLSIR